MPFIRNSKFPDFSHYFSKGLDIKAKVNLKIYGSIKWETNNYNAHIAQ